MHFIVFYLARLNILSDSLILKVMSLTPWFEKCWKNHASLMQFC